MITVDSSVWINLLRAPGTTQDQRLAALLRRGQRIAITDVIYTELLKGAQTAREVSRTQRRLEQTTMLRLRELGDFERAADLYRRARRAGHTIRNTTDCLIAAVCIREQVPLLHDDIDFDRIADVSDLQVA